MAEKIRKRNGKVENFDRRKLLKSIHISMARSGLHNPRLEEKITDEVTKKLKKKTISVENVRSTVCSVLKKNKHHDVCSFYSLVWLHAKPVKIKYVVKRNGKKEKFSPEKLFKSVQKSFRQSYQKDGLLLEKVMNDILEKLNNRYRGKNVAYSEIKDIVEMVLLKRKLNNTARHYIMYRYT